MHSIQRLSLFGLSSILLLGADEPVWKSKPVADWSNEDAQQVLTESPWVKRVNLKKVRDLSKFERRDGGNMSAGIGPTVDFGAIGLFGPVEEDLAFARARDRAPRDYGSVVVRWESALPVHIAETRVGDDGAPMWHGEYYAIGVYDITPPFRWNLANQLKGVAFLKRGKHHKDLKPSRVLVSFHPDGLATLVYLFSRLPEIGAKEPIGFQAQIGRLFVSQLFFPEEMQFQGRPEF
jgi:hypothetical protein